MVCVVVFLREVEDPTSIKIIKLKNSSFCGPKIVETQASIGNILIYSNIFFKVQSVSRSAAVATAARGQIVGTS